MNTGQIVALIGSILAVLAIVGLPMLSHYGRWYDKGRRDGAYGRMDNAKQGNPLIDYANDTRGFSRLMYDRGYRKGFIYGSPVAARINRRAERIAANRERMENKEW